MFVREDRGDVAILRMSHGKVSALDAEFCEAMTAEIGRLERGRARAVVLTGTGTSFCAGVHLFRLLDGGIDYVRQFLPVMNRFFRSLLLLSKPLVVAVNGHAIAGGCIIVATGDHRVMARGSGRIGVAELAVGIPFPRLPLEIVAARLSPALLRTLVYSGRTVHADEAAAVGFVDEAVDAEALLDRAMSMAEQLATIPPTTFALTKRALTDPIIDRVSQTDDSGVFDAWMSGEVHAAIRTYLAKTIKPRT